VDVSLRNDLHPDDWDDETVSLDADSNQAASTSILTEQIIAASRRIMRAVDLSSWRLLAEHGVTEPQLLALREAGRMGRPAVTELARAIHLSQGTVTGIIDRLERRGLMARTRDGRDRRAVHVTVTDAGRQMLNTAPPILKKRLDAELAKLKDWERTGMLSALQRVGDMMGDVRLDDQ
jgi:DNA-binding MarR family transcriptional regulator